MDILFNITYKSKTYTTYTTVSLSEINHFRQFGSSIRDRLCNIPIYTNKWDKAAIDILARNVHFKGPSRTPLRTMEMHHCS